MDFEVDVWNGSVSYIESYQGRYETREGGFLLVIDDESGTKITYGPSGWLWVKEAPDEE